MVKKFFVSLALLGALSVFAAPAASAAPPGCDVIQSQFPQEAHPYAIGAIGQHVC